MRYCPVMGVASGQSIEFSVSDVFTHSWLGSTATGGSISYCIRRNIWFAANPVKVLKEHLSQLVDTMYQLYKTFACTTRISLGLMINAGVLLTSSTRLIFGGPVTTLGLTGKSLSAVM